MGEIRSYKFMCLCAVCFMAVNADVHKFMCVYVQCASWL